jgi:4-oxalomesaconate hydratase
VDITAVIDRKRAAMAEISAQSYLQTYYDQRADHRGNHARRASGLRDLQHAEAFQRVIPEVVEQL